MDRACRHQSGITHVEIFQDGEHLERCRPLTVWRHAIDTHTITVIDMIRLHPAGMLRRKIRARHPAANAFEIGFDGIGNRAVIIGITAAFGDHAQGPRKFGILDDLALDRRAATAHIDLLDVLGLLDTRIGRQVPGHVALHAVGDHETDRHTLFRDLGGRRQQIFPWQLPVLLVQGPPGIHRPRNRNSSRAEEGNPAIRRPLPQGLQRERCR